MSKYEPCYHKGETGFMDTDLVLNDIRKWLNETNDEQTLIDTLDICLFFGKIENQEQEIKRLKEEYVMLQNASDEVEEELQQRIDKAIEYIDWVWNNTNKPTNTIVVLRTLEYILQGVDKE